MNLPNAVMFRSAIRDRLSFYSEMKLYESSYHSSATYTSPKPEMGLALITVDMQSI